MTEMNRREFAAAMSAIPLASGLLPARQASAPSAFGAAMDSLRAGIAIAEADPDRPVYHFRPPANWNNDPNGTLYYRGWHHLFYQLNPSASRGGNQHWGHARSRDLVNWEHLPIALWPLADRGERAIFSGGATLGPDGRPRLFYTSIGHPSPEQWIALPQDEDLVRWERPALNPVLAIGAHGSLTVSQWRDPFLLTEGRNTYMVCGGNLNGGRGGGGCVLLYRASNPELTRWDFVGVVYRYRDLQIYNVECPNLFRLGGKWVLLMSPQQPCEYFIGELDVAKPQFIPETHGVLDAGNAYASNISVDDRGRTILWLWGRTNTAPDRGWNGVMVLPRILSIDANGFLRQQPAAEFEQLRGTAVTRPAVDLTPGSPLRLEGISGDSLELVADLLPGNASEIGFDFRCGAEARPGISVRIARPGVLVVGNTRTPVSRGLSRYRLRVFLDKRVVEVYVNDGEAAVYGTVEASPSSTAVAAVSAQAAANARPAGGPGGSAAGGTPRVEGLTAWPLSPARFDLDRVRL
jgi:beta-fructofuranosidase